MPLNWSKSASFTPSPSLAIQCCKSIFTMTDKNFLMFVTSKLKEANNGE